MRLWALAAVELLPALLAFGAFALLIIYKALVPMTGGVLLILTGLFRKRREEQGGNHAVLKLFGQSFDIAGGIAGVTIFAGLSIALVGILSQK
ncbi:MAG TPA: hypothetical protein VG889_21160 [Rhizomicrobium sp.]|nr:hypothetical protein [Rhizomicrobium sp.]